MTKRVLMFGAVVAVFVAALLAVLRVMDLVSVQQATESLGRTLSVILISTVAIVVMATLVRIAKKQ
jgi:hypothetical protein